MANLKKPELKISAALMVFPNGRAIAKEAAAYASRARNTIEVADVICDRIMECQQELAAAMRHAADGSGWTGPLILKSLIGCVTESFMGQILSRHLSARVESKLASIMVDLQWYGVQEYLDLTNGLLRGESAWETWAQETHGHCPSRCCSCFQTTCQNTACMKRT